MKLLIYLTHKFTLTGKKVLFVILIYAFGVGIYNMSYAQAQPEPQAKSTQSQSIRLRKFKQQHLQKYLSDEDFKYDREFSPESPSLWQRFKRWLFYKLLESLSNEQTRGFWSWTIYIICGLIILYVILKLTKTNIRGLFFGQAQSSNLNFSETEENIHVLNFDQLISEAIAAQHYGKAIRLFYLKTLKQLTDRNMIDWRINKTNYDYVRELGTKEVAPDFRNLTSLFEYIYYGDFQITQADFEQAQTAFKNFEDLLKR